MLPRASLVSTPDRTGGGPEPDAEDRERRLPLGRRLPSRKLTDCSRQRRQHGLIAGPAPAAVNAVFQAGPLGTADLFSDGVVAPVGGADAFPDLAPEPGHVDNPPMASARDLSLADLAAAGIVVFGLLGAAWDKPAGNFSPRARIKPSAGETFGASKG
jgi:hypothetical protein